MKYGPFQVHDSVRQVGNLPHLCSAALLSFAVLCATISGSLAAQPRLPLRAGMIGLDTSHSLAFTRLLLDPKAAGDLKDLKVVAAYPGGSPDIPSSRDRVKEFTGQMRGLGIEIVDSIDDLLRRVDVVMLMSVDGRVHLAQARPVIAAGKPLFIDKPLAASLADAAEIFRLAREHHVPCFSSSALRFSSGFQALRQKRSPLGDVRGCVAWSPLHLEPHHPDLFWYGIHGVETLYTIMGPGCKTVTRPAPDKVVGAWADGRTGTFVAKNDYGAQVEGSRASGPAGRFEGYAPLVVEIARFFKTGRPPVAAEETLEILAFMEAADESKRLGGAPVQIETIMARVQSAPSPANNANSSANGGWRKYEGNPVMGGKYGTCFDISVLRDHDTYRMWLSWRPKRSVALVESKDGIHWSEPPQIVFGPRKETGWEDNINRPYVLKKGNAYHMWYTGQMKPGGRDGHSWIGYATSPDGVTWKRMSDKPVLSFDQAWEKSIAVMCPSVLWDEEAKLFRMWYCGGEQNEPNAIGYATSPDGLAWKKYEGNPVFGPEAKNPWEKHKVAGVQVERHGDWYLMFYIGYETEPKARICLARSRDGITNWQRHPANPIIWPGKNQWDHDACYKPYALFDGTKWLLWYNGRHGGLEQIGVATHEGEDLGFDR